MKRLRADMSAHSKRVAAKVAAIAIGLALWSSSAAGQSAYFPMNTGDSWILANTPENSLSVNVGNSLTLNAESYFQLNIPFGRSDTLRIDSEGRVWEYLAGSEQVLFDFGAASQTIYAPPDSWNAKKILVSRGITVTTPVATFENCVVFDIDRAMILGDYSFAFAPGVGIVQAVDSMGTEYLLRSASVGGLSVATVTPEPVAERGDWLVYPVPTTGPATIRRRHAGNASAGTRLVVYDMQGKKVMTRHLGVYGGPWKINLSRLAPGVYHALIQENGVVSSVRIVRS